MSYDVKIYVFVRYVLKRMSTIMLLTSCSLDAELIDSGSILEVPDDEVLLNVLRCQLTY